MAHRSTTGHRFLVAAMALFLMACGLLSPPARASATVAAAALPPSNRVTINLGETPWRYLKDVDPPAAMTPAYDDSSANTTAVWSSVGVPQTPADNDTFLNVKAGGGQGQLTGNTIWYRKHFTLDASYADRKVFVEFEGAHMGTQVYINGNLLPTNSLVNPAATHVVGFVPFIVDLTPYVQFGGADNVMAVKVSRGDSFFVNPNFSGAFRFGQADGGLFRPVWMYIEDRVHIPQNTWSTLNTWGTYVSTLSAGSAQALVRVQTNVRNEYSTAQNVTLTTQIVDAAGNVVASAQDTQTLASNPLPLAPAKLAPDTAPAAATFDDTLTVVNPTLWYPNNSTFGKPYLYTVVSTVSINGTVVDATTTPLGIRTITWDQNFPYINGHQHYLWGGSGRYDYPALGSAVPEEQKWRDVSLLAEAGGSLYRPGHSSEGPEFIAAADAYGVMVIQPSGDGENGFASLCPDSTGSDHPNGCTANGSDIELKKETHRDMIVHDRNDPAVLAWEADNGVTDTTFAQSIKALSQVWDPVLTRAQSDRTPNPANGDILGCSGDGCDIGVKNSYPNSPAWGSEYWGDGVQRSLYDYELLFAVNPVKNWSQGLRSNVFGMAHWYLADTPGEITTQVDGPDSSYGLTTGVQPVLGSTVGTQPFMMRGNAASMMDANRIPRLLYYIYQAAWTPYDLKPVVKLGYHWNRTGNVTVNAFSNCPAVRLLINGQTQGSDQTPNPQTIDPGDDTGPNTVSLPRQVHWNVSWAAGTLTAECLDADGRVVSDASGQPVTDTKITAGAADHIQLTVTPELVRPDGSSFQVTANGTDAAFVTASVVDAAGNLVPTADDIITFSVAGAGTYRGSADSYVSFTPGQVPHDDAAANGIVTNALPQGYHAPGDPNLSAEGGMTRIAVRSIFTPGTVTVTATAPGLGAGTASFATQSIAGPSAVGTELQVPGQPVNALAIVTQPSAVTVATGQVATFTVLVSGSGSIAYQWRKNGAAIAGAISFTYTTPATASTDDAAQFSVDVTNGSTTVSSNPAVLGVVAPTVPTIVTAPQAQTVVAGQNAEFSVVASGSPTLTYQWLKNGADISGATSAVYDTPIVLNADDGAVFSVQVSNSAGQVVSAGALLHVAAATAPTIVTQPHNLQVAESQTATFSVLASGSAPLNYQWLKDGVDVGSDSPTLVIASAQTSDAGTYTVVVTNPAGAVTSDSAVLSVSGSSGSDLAQGKTAYESSEQNAGLTAAFAFDGSQTTRWSSAPGVDPSWIAVDLGAATTFDRVVLNWENAYATQYEFQVSSDNQTWTDALPAITGHGGTETINFPSTTARYVRMLGTQRATQYGYSLYEFGVYDVPQCGGATERFTLQAAQSGTYVSQIAGIPDGPFVPTVLDNVSQLTWQQYVTTFQEEGAQFTQDIARSYCQSVNMRLPTQSEALSVAGSNFASCAFPNPWTTWTVTSVPNQTGRAYFVSSAGVSSSQIIDNSPGASLCVSGTTAVAPTITGALANQSAAVGATATFTVGVTGGGPLSYQWLENGNAVGQTSVSSYTTSPLQASDDNAVFSVIVSNPGGSVTSNGATLTVTESTGTTTGTGTGTGTTTGTGTGTGGTTSVASTNLALGKTATASSLQDVGDPASAATDGNFGTRWASGADDAAWITVDLGSSQTFDRVVLRWEAAYGRAYQIVTSDDGQTWSAPVFTQTAGTGGTEELRFTAVTARFVRMQGVKRATQYGYSLFEFEVYDTATTPQFAISATAGANGSVTPAGTVEVYQGGGQAFAFQPAVGYAVTGVVVDGQSAGLQQTYAFTNVQAAHTIAATFGPTSAGTNLALKQPTFASGLESAAYPSNNATDGDRTTRWSSDFDDDAWITVDLGTVRPVNRIIFRWENAHATAYRVLVSNDNATWSAPVYSTTASLGGTEDISFTEVSARYVRMQGVQRSSGYGYSLYEFEIYDMPVAPAITTQLASQTVAVGQAAQFTVAATGTAPLSYQWLANGQVVATTSTPSYTTAAAASTDSGTVYDVIVSNSAGSVTGATATLTVTGGTSTSTITGTTSTGTNLALGKTATASGTENAIAFPAQNAVDGDLTTRFSSAFVDPSWIAIDLGAAQPVNRVVFVWERAYATAYQVQVSSDNQTWTPVLPNGASSSTIAGQGGTETIDFPLVTARYVRMYGLQRATQYGYSLWEFQVYDTDTTGSSTTTASAPTISAQPQNASVAIGQSAEFSVTAAGTGPFTYQWFENGTAIAGATGTAYSTPATSATDNGATFDVVVANVTGSVTSSVAALTVGAAAMYTVYPGFIGIDLQNLTNGAYTDDQVYVTVLGRDPATGVFAWLKPDGTLTDATAADNDATGHLVKNGVNYANYAFTLAQSKLLKLPQMDSGRVYVSLGEPVYIKILTDVNNQIGYAGPNPLNATDPNVAVNFDWYEFTYNAAGLWMNTTQVDEFGFPLLLDVYGANATFHQQTGINQSRASLYAAYLAETPALFHENTLSPYRIFAPYNDTFDVGEANASYFDAYVDQVWTTYASTPLVIDMWGGSRRFSGTTQGTQFVFTEIDLGNGAYAGGTYVVNKPTTQDILRGAGALATGNATELALEAQMCAAFNRHIMEDVTKWSTPSAWYATAPANYYAKFWHDHSVGGLAYGFAYDDVSNQSSTITTGQPEHAVFGIGW